MDEQPIHPKVAAWDLNRQKLNAGFTAGNGQEKKHRALFEAQAATRGKGYMNK